MAQDILADGFVKLCIDPSLNVFDGKCRYLIEGQALDDGTATVDVLTPVTAERNLEALFGQGSVLTETLRKVFCTCPNNLEIFAIPRADPASSVAAVYTLTITGTATTDGRIELFMLDSEYEVNVLIEAGFTPTQIASAIVADISDDFPYDVTSALGVVTFTAKNKGTIGNFLNVINNWRGLVNYAPESVSLAFVQTTPGTGDLTPLDYDAILGTCCYSCFVPLGGGSAYQDAWQAYLETKWDCEQPQCFGHGYVYNSGSLGSILARGTNAAVFSRVAHSTLLAYPPYFASAAYAALSCCSACDNPELSIQGRTFGVLECLKIPENCTEPFTYDERVQLMDAGFVVLGPVSGGAGAYTSPYVFNDVTNYLYDENGRENATFRDANSRRLTTATAIAVAEKLNEFSGLGLYTINTQIPAKIFGTNPRLILGKMRTWAKANVGILFSEFEDIDSDIQIKTDFEVAPKCQGKPGKLHMPFRYRPPVRISDFVVGLQPKLLDNCRR